MIYQRLGRFANGVQGCDSAVGPYIKHQPFVVGDLPDSGSFDGVVYFADWIKYGINGQNPYGQAGNPLALHRLLISYSLFDIELDRQGSLVRVQGCQVQLRVNDLEVGGCGYVAGAHNTLSGDFQPHLPGRLGLGVNADSFNIEQEVHDLLFHAGDGRVLVHYIIDLDPGDGTAFNRA